MYEHKVCVDPAYSLLLVDVLEQMLRYAGQPDRVGYALCEHIREITGARLVVLLPPEGRGERLQFIAYPERRREIAESLEARALFKVAMQTNSIMLWDKGSQDSAGARLLFAWKMENCLSVPLSVGESRMGTLIIMDFSFTGNVDSLIGTMDRMSGVLGLVLRNAGFYREVEQFADEQTRELNEIIEVLQKDITDRKRAEDALRKSERKFRAIFDQTFQLVGLMTIDGVLIEVNRTALGSVGAEEPDVLGKPFWEGPWWAHSQELQDKLRRSIEKAAKGAFVRFEATYLSVDGSLRYLDFSIKPVTDESGRVVLLIPEGRDITERKRAEEALEDAKNQAELYVDLMGHDISNMDHAIMGYLELAMDTLDLNEDEKELIARPIELIKNSTSLIDNVKKLRRLKAGLSQKKIMDLGQVMEGVKLQYSNVPGREAVIHYTPVSGCHVMADELLKDVFVNLVENAIKHSHGALTVNLGLTRTYGDGHIFYKAIVEDNGPGMPDELKSRVLDRLCLVKLGTTGRGMGLCVVKALVDSYNGKISVEDRVPGDYTQGARFVVMLPAV